MKLSRILAMALGLLLVGTLSAQENKANTDWYNCSFGKDGVYGAEVNKAYALMAGKKASYKPVVAIIGSSIDLEHEALRGNVWMNPKEKADGKDNDGNGLVDDIHGWNFIGGKDGVVMEKGMQEGDREWFRLKDRYADLAFDGKTYFKYIDGKRVNVPQPKDMKEYQYFKELISSRESYVAGMYAGWVMSHIIAEYGKQFFAKMRAANPGKTSFTMDDFTAVNNKFTVKDSLETMALAMVGMHIGVVKGYVKGEGADAKVMAFVMDYYENGKNIPTAWESYQEKLKKHGDDQRRIIVGDDPTDINDRAYGNAVMLTSNANGGTMAAGIIAGKRGVEGRQSPICEQAQIMELSVINNSGEPYLKDIALALRYAVDHGADIILLTQENSLYPPLQRVWVEEALKYAESKGVLVIIPTAERSLNLGVKTFYPNRFVTASELTNLMVVSPSDLKGNPALKSNFGAKEVDLYAPGESVYSIFPGDVYKSGSGSVIAGATVAGVAALVKSYFPKLTGTQIRTLLNENVTSREGVEVEKMFIDSKGKPKQDVYLFDELCLSKGIVNACKALEAAKAIK